MTSTSGGWDFGLFAWPEELPELEPLVSSGVTMFTQPPGGQPCPVPDDLLPDELEEPPEEVPEESHPMFGSHANARGVPNMVSQPSRHTATASIRASFMSLPEPGPNVGHWIELLQDIGRRAAGTVVSGIKAEDSGLWPRRTGVGVWSCGIALFRRRRPWTSMLGKMGSPSHSLVSWPTKPLVAG